MADRHSTPDKPVTGGCLCGAVRFRVTGPLRVVLLCHCTMCQRQHTHAGAYTACDPVHLVMETDAELRWYRSSPEAKRGFCSVCGAGLFWKADAASHISISAGSMDRQDTLTFGRHTFLAERSPFLPAIRNTDCEQG